MCGDSLPKDLAVLINSVVTIALNARFNPNVTRDVVELVDHIKGFDRMVYADDDDPCRMEPVNLYNAEAAVNVYIANARYHIEHRYYVEVQKYGWAVIDRFRAVSIGERLRTLVKGFKEKFENPSSKED